jgi:hypothetical protein
MLYLRRALWLALLVASLILEGCPLRWFTKEGYGGIVVAHLPPQPTDALRAAVRQLPGLQGPKRRVQGGNPRCGYYDKRLERTRVLVGISECDGPTNLSETGWAYSVDVNTTTRHDPAVRAEVDALLAEIRNAILPHVGTAKVTVRAEPFSLP